MTDMELLHRYAAANDHDAFAELVRRHLDWVYSACRRQVRDAFLAQDVTQVVFLTLARKARSMSPATSISGWLFTTSRFAAASALRMERRRRRHEREAALMRPSPEDAELETHWQQIEPFLDAALARLPAADRDAIILRYYRGLTHHKVGDALGISEQAAQKRITRALERLRSKLQPTAPLSPAVIAAVLTRHATQPAPPALLKTGAIAPAAFSSAKIETLVKGVLIMQKISSAKLAAAAAIAILALLGGGSYVALKQFSATVAAPPGVPFVIGDLHDVQSMLAEGTNDDGVPTKLLISRARGAVAHQTFPFGTRVQVISPDGQEWDYLEGKPMVVHFPQKRASLQVLMPELEQQFKLLAQSSPSRQVADDTAIDGVNCEAFALNEGALAGGVAWKDPRTNRLQQIQLPKLHFNFRYDVAVAPEAFDIPSGASVQAIDAADYLEERYPVSSAKYIAQLGAFVFAVHEIHCDTAGRFLIVCSARPKPALASSLKDLPADADLLKLRLGGSAKMVELARIEQGGTQLMYVAMMPPDQAEGVCELSVIAESMGLLLSHADAEPTSTVTLAVKAPQGVPEIDLRTFALQAYDAVAPMAGLMHITSLTFSRPLGSLIPGREEYVQAVQARAAHELAWEKAP